MNTTIPYLSVRRPDDLAAIPSVVAELMADEPELTAHLAVAERYEQMRVKATELARELEQARRDDDERRREALAAGKKPKEPRAKQVEEELLQARHDVDLLADALRSSAVAFATRAVAHVHEAAAELERRREAALDRLRDLFRAAESAIAEHGALGAEGNWIAALLLSGRVVAYRPGARTGSLPRTAESIRRLTFDLDEDVRRADEIAATREREEAAEKPPPPGARLWAPGELVEDAEAGRP
jgi:hypothetical protein